MKQIAIGCLVIGVVLFLCGGISILGSYNGLVGQEETVDTAWADVETQYQRRYDLIPNLTNAVQGIFNQEQQVFKDIADARTRYAGAESGSTEQIEAQSSLDSAISRLLVIVESYPELKSNEQVTGLMDELAGTENRINVARQRYNEAARGYNTNIRQFPTNIFAGMFGFERKPLFEAQEGAENAPVVNLNGDENK